MSLKDRVKVRREQQAQRQKVQERVHESPSFNEKMEEESSLPREAKEVAVDYNMKLTLRPLQVDEHDNDYDRRSVIYKTPLNDDSLNIFRLVCLMSQKNCKYLNKMRYSSADADCPLHFLPVLECALVKAEPLDPWIPLDEHSTPLVCSPRTSLTGCQFDQSDHGKTTRMPSRGLSSVNDTDHWLLYLRYATASRKDSSSWGTLASCLEEGRWVSEKLILKWSVQLVRSLWNLYRHFFTFGSVYSRDVSLISDQTMVNMNAVKDTYILKTEERALAKNLYNPDFKGVYLRSSEMEKRLNKDREDMIKKKNALEKQSSLPEEDEGDGVGGLMGQVTTSSFLANAKLESSEEREQRRKLFSLGDSTERRVLMEKEGIKVDQSQKRKDKDLAFAPNPSTRKDAWLQIPFDAFRHVKYLTSKGDSRVVGHEDTASIDSSLLSLSVTSSEAFDPEIPRKNKYPGCIGDNKCIKREKINRHKQVDSNQQSLGDMDIVNRPASKSLDRSGKPHKFRWYKEVSEATKISEFAKVLSLSKTIIPKISKIDKILLKNDSDKEKLNRAVKACKLSFETFLGNIHMDFRYLGILIIEAHIRSTIDNVEKEVMLRPSYTYDDLKHFFDLSRMSHAMKNLMKFCFTVQNNSDLVESLENDSEYFFRSVSTLPEIDTILQDLEKELSRLGGVACPDLSPPESYLTEEDREKQRQDRERRKLELEKKAIEGRYKAVDRVEEHKKQMMFDLLDGAQQDAILRRREAEAQSEKNRIERSSYFRKALFHRQHEEQAIAWIREGIFQGLVKMFKVKRSGVKMSLDQKFLYERVVKPVEMVMKRILKQNPMVIVNEVTEKQALLQATKDAAAESARSAKGGKKKKKKVEKEEEMEMKKEKEKEEEEESVGKRSKSEKDEQGNEIKLNELTPLELEKTYMHVFSIFSKKLAKFLGSCVSNIITDLRVLKHHRVAYYTSLKIRKALADAEDLCHKSPVTSLLPPVQFKEKVTVTAARKLQYWENIVEASELLRVNLKVKDEGWKQKAMGCLSSCLMMKYSLDEKARRRGEAIAADMLQGLVRGFLTRAKIKKIWEIADKRYEKEYEKYLAQQEIENEAKQQLLLKEAETKSSFEEQKRKEELNKIGVDWAEAYIDKTTPEGATIQINLRIGGKLPLKDYFRDKNLDCAIRLYKQADQLPDPDCSAYKPSDSKPVIGEIELVVDDKKIVEKKRKDWMRYASNELLPTSMKWNSSVKLKKSKLINVYDARNDGSDLDIASCFIEMKGLKFHSVYALKVLVCSEFNPALTETSEVDMAKVAVLEFLTGPCPPSPPKAKKPDIIHFDHAINIEKSSFGGVPELSDEDVEAVDAATNNSTGHHLSIVDRLERFKNSQLQKRSDDFLHKKGLIERRVSVRIQWDIPQSNGSPITQYELQRRGNQSQDKWESLLITTENFFTDTIPEKDRITGELNRASTYRIRAGNSVGWGAFCKPFDVNLVDRIQQQRLQGSILKNKHISDQGSLLPHGVRVKHQDSGSENPTKLLTHDEVKDLIHSNMLCTPVPSSQSDGMESDASMDEASARHDGDLLKTVEIDRDSSLSGNSLEDLNDDLQAWLSRLSDACPLEDENVWKAGKRIQASMLLHASEDVHEWTEEEEAAASSSGGGPPLSFPPAGAQKKPSIQSLKNNHVRRSIAETTPPGRSPQTIEMKMEKRRNL